MAERETEVAPLPGRLQYARLGICARGIVLCGFLLLAVMAQGAAVRVTTWSLQPSTAADTNGASQEYQRDLVREAGEVLKKLNPDVIVLQQVRDWQDCNELVKALKPAKYNVAAWSSFRDARTGTLSKQQVAILSKSRAYISWSEAWKENGRTSLPGGFAFAAIRAGGKNTAFFSVQLDGDSATGDEWRSETQQTARAESVRQLLDQVATLRKWTTNRVHAVVVAGDFDTTLDDSALTHEKTLPQLEGFGFASAFAGLPLEKRITLPSNGKQPDATVDYIFTLDAGHVTTPEIVSAALTQHNPVTCEIELDAPSLSEPVTVAHAEPPAMKVAAARTNVAEKTLPVAQAATATTMSARNSNWKIAGIIAGGILLLLAVWKLARGRVEAGSAVMLAMETGSASGSSRPPNTERIVVAAGTVETSGSAADHPPIVHIESSGSAQAQFWQQRAEEAEKRAARATATVRQGLIPHLSEWLKSKLVQRLASDRASLLETQRTATLKLQVVDERLTKIERQLQERNRVYEQRIEELEKELVEAREENRELIRAKIAQVKREMEKERAEAARQAKG